jgi:hypothetical protein
MNSVSLEQPPPQVKNAVNSKAVKPEASLQNYALVLLLVIASMVVYYVYRNPSGTCDSCSSPTVIPYDCQASPCQLPGGSCVKDSLGNTTCACQGGFTGTDCTVAPVSRVPVLPTIIQMDGTDALNAKFVIVHHGTHGTQITQAKNSPYPIMDANGRPATYLWVWSKTSDLGGGARSLVVAHGFDGSQAALSYEELDVEHLLEFHSLKDVPPLQGVLRNDVKFTRYVDMKKFRNEYALFVHLSSDGVLKGMHPARSPTLVQLAREVDADTRAIDFDTLNWDFIENAGHVYYLEELTRVVLDTSTPPSSGPLDERKNLTLLDSDNKEATEAWVWERELDHCNNYRWLDFREPLLDNTRPLVLIPNKDRTKFVVLENYTYKQAWRDGTNTDFVNTLNNASNEVVKYLLENRRYLNYGSQFNMEFLQRNPPATYFYLQTEVLAERVTLNSTQKATTRRFLYTHLPLYTDLDASPESFDDTKGQASTFYYRRDGIAPVPNYEHALHAIERVQVTDSSQETTIVGLYESKDAHLVRHRQNQSTFAVLVDTEDVTAKYFWVWKADADRGSSSRALVVAFSDDMTQCTAFFFRDTSSDTTDKQVDRMIVNGYGTAGELYTDKGGFVYANGNSDGEVASMCHFIKLQNKNTTPTNTNNNVRFQGGIYPTLTGLGQSQSPSGNRQKPYAFDSIKFGTYYDPINGSLIVEHLIEDRVRVDQDLTRVESGLEPVTNVFGKNAPVVWVFYPNKANVYSLLVIPGEPYSSEGWSAILPKDYMDLDYFVKNKVMQKPPLASGNSNYWRYSRPIHTAIRTDARGHRTLLLSDDGVYSGVNPVPR